jgi:UDP-3-O-[3-hydroxymyristoyl] N-acetylglucosamine deacetylase
VRKQRTIAQEASLSGIGLHTGETVTLRLLPADEGTGIRFRRSDMSLSPDIPATVDYVQDTSRSTNIGIGDAKIYTVEHVLAAARACSIDNLIIEVSGSEPPVADGSSLMFMNMIEEAGIREQDALRHEVCLKEPVSYSHNDIHLVAIPSSEYKISYTLHYPNERAIRTQYFSTVITNKTFRDEIASSRTFSRYDEISYLIDKGLIRGGSLDNAVVLMGDVALSKEGLRYPNEMVRHKILDLIGDLSLVGVPFKAHIIAIMSGHTTNVAFARKISEQITMENN